MKHSLILFKFLHPVGIWLFTPSTVSFIQASSGHFNFQDLSLLLIPSSFEERVKQQRLCFALFYTFNNKLILISLLPHACVRVRARHRDLEVLLELKCVYKLNSLKKMSCLLQRRSASHAHTQSNSQYCRTACTQTHTCKSNVELEPEENGRRLRERYKVQFVFIK